MVPGGPFGLQEFGDVPEGAPDLPWEIADVSGPAALVNARRAANVDDGRARQINLIPREKEDGSL